MELAIRALGTTKAATKSSAREVDDGRWILREMADTIRQIEEGEQMYNLAEDDDILEYYIYTRKALEAKYRFLLQTARRRGLSLRKLPRAR